LAYNRIVKHYVEGFCWVLLYYYQGCPSWTWYYPYHFAPFASDFEQISDLDITFSKGTPFKPAEQLMGVLPAASQTLIAKPFRHLMTNEDSPIIDFYPEDFQIDMNGKKMLWQGVALLPFIDEVRLLDAMRPLYAELNEEDRARNEMGNEILFVGQQNSLYDIFGETFYAMKDDVEAMHLNPTMSKRLIGAVAKDDNCIPHGSYAFPFSSSSSSYSSIDHDITLRYQRSIEAS
jgi:5'-3' exoribonuclease 2